MVTATVVIAIAVLLFLSRHFLYDLLSGSAAETQAFVRSLPRFDAAEVERVTAPFKEAQRRRQEARRAFPDDMYDLASNGSLGIDPVERGLSGESFRLYLEAKDEVMSAYITHRVPAPWAVQTIRTYQRRHHARQTRRTAQVLKVS